MATRRWVLIVLVVLLLSAVAAQAALAVSGSPDLSAKAGSASNVALVLPPPSPPHNCPVGFGGICPGIPKV